MTACVRRDDTVYRVSSFTATSQHYQLKGDNMPVSAPQFCFNKRCKSQRDEN